MRCKRIVSSEYNKLIGSSAETNHVQRVTAGDVKGERKKNSYRETFLRFHVCLWGRLAGNEVGMR